ncbi:unnamed protein product [Rotaria socialis]|uniref:G-protein coupled receptors family 1 profile domain-containing protein n=3 Tax=Rotaria socialis TaxID=392032 RepID=A0A818RLQ8_9BILA|nr:unnamed protein product [Rotaria socialis]CAF3336082.1 unnamed protein product [Rotaria socialis]CAF3340569.1 unnamed protein product [Rotaria socialis]CAF3655967.1 unnamed protein product [Rotaria socialis]CAF3765317.1 unnamed protein product [Rotaria socialis]
MTSLSDENLIPLLDTILDEMNLYLSLFIFIFGIVGNILNCLVLSQRILRSNPCALYFLSSSIVNLISIVFGLTTRIMASWHLDPTHTNDWICKFRVYIVFTSRSMSIWLIMLATVDRWLLSSRKGSRRNLSNLKIAKLGICTSFVLSNWFYIHMIYCYEANILDAPLKCYGKNTACRLVTDLVYGLLTILIPSIVMMSFSIMIISNIHHLRGRIKRVTILSIRGSLQRRQMRLRSADHHLLRMLLIEVLLLVIFCLPQALHKFYITFKPINSNNNRLVALNHFLYNFDVLLAFMVNGMPFYLYTLAGKTIFRRVLLELLRMFRRKIKLQ